MPRTMPRRPRAPVFLEQEGYRRRRVADAARALPIVGGFLVMLPLIWPSVETEGGVSTVSAFLFIFGIWVFLICGAAVLAGRLTRRRKR